MKSQFKKNDQNKLRYSLLDFNFINDLVEVLELGAKKYGVDNWKECDDRQRYINAIFRHLVAYMLGEEIDSESNKSHLAHIGCNIMFLQWLDKNNKGVING